MSLKTIKYLLLLVSMMMTLNASADVAVNATNFPDENFRNWVLSNISGASDGMLTDEEIANVTSIDCNSKSIASLKGIEFFSALTTMDCSHNQLTSLDVSKNTKLTSLSCDNNQLASLDVSKNTRLIYLDCERNLLTSLDVSKNTALITFWCHSNKLTSLDVSKNTALTSLSCYFNQLTSLDVSKNTILAELWCYSNLLTSLDVSNNTALTQLFCYSNQLTNLDVSKNTALTKLSCHSNQLTSLDLSKNPSIKNASIGSQTTSLKAVSTGAGVAIPMPSDFDFTKVSNLKLDGTSVSGSLTTVNGQKYLVFAQAGTAQSSIDGKKLTYQYNTGNSFSSAASMDVTVSLSYDAPKTYTLSIQSGSGGSISYDGTTVTNTTKSFTVVEGTSATISISPNSGYKLSKLTVNGTNVTSSVSNNQYTISNITANTSVVATFEQITYTLSVQAAGMGVISYNNNSIKNATRTYTVNHGSSATFTITPDTGYRLASLTVNGTDVTSSVSNGKYTVSNITANTIVVATFEQIPVTYYTLSIQSGSGGSVSYDGTTVTNTTKSFSIAEGASATISISPNTGYKLSRLTVNGTNVTSSVSNNQYTISNITANTTVFVTFEAIPQTTYTLSITASGYGSATYNGSSARNQTRTFTVNEGVSATVSFSPDNGYRIASVKVNNTDVTSQLTNNQYNVNNIISNTNITVTFEANAVTGIEINAINFPDVNFRNWVLSNISGANDGILTEEEISIVTSIHCSNTNIANLKGIEFFIALTELQCGGNQLTSLDVSKNTKLIHLDCNNNKLTSLDVSKNTALDMLECFNNQLTSLNVKNNTKLFTLDCNTNLLTSLDVSNNTILVYLLCYSNSLTSLDVSKNTALKNLFCGENQLTSLDVSNNTALQMLYCDENQLTSLNVSNNTKLTSLFCQENKLMTLDLSKNTSLPDGLISPQNLTLTVVNISAGVAIPVPPDFNLSKVSELRLNGTIVTGNVTTENGQMFLVFAQTGTAASSINGKVLTYSYSTGNSHRGAASMDVTVTLSYTPTTYTLSIQSGSGGYVSYDGTIISNTTKSFSVASGSSATISITPHSGYRLNELSVNGTDITVQVSNNQYTISSITSDTYVIATFTKDGEPSGSVTKTVEGSIVTFLVDGAIEGEKVTVDLNEQGWTSGKAVDPATITLSDGTKITFDKGEGSNTPAFYDATKGVRVYAKNTITISGKAVAKVVLYCDSFNGIGYVGNSTLYGSAEGTTFVICNEFSENKGGDQLRVQKIEITYAVTDIEPINVSISASGNGNAFYNGTTIRDESKSFSLYRGASATISFTPDNGYRIGSVKVNNTDVTANVTNNQYTVNNILTNTSVSVTFADIEYDNLSNNGVNYRVVSNSDKTVNVASGSYGYWLTVPASFTANGFDWSVTGIDKDVISNNPQLAAVIWNPAVQFTASVTNPNFLLYVTSSQYAPSAIKNVVVGNTANSITLTDASSGNNFYCPREFTTRSISYSHSYGMTTGISEARGWESISLPFDVEAITHSSKGTLVPFTNWQEGGSTKPFWLYQLGSGGFVEANAIIANTPYIISMPNNAEYLDEYRVSGTITFSSTDVTVKSSESLQNGTYGDRTFIPNFINQDANSGFYVLNAVNNYSANSSGYAEGSRFVRNLRAIHPFEAYIASANNAKESFPIFEDETTWIRSLSPIPSPEGKGGIYDISGRRIQVNKVTDYQSDQFPALQGGARGRLQKGVYIVNGKKIVIR